MMEMISTLMGKEGARYIFFGGCTAAVSFLSYWLFRSVLGCNIATAGCLAATLAILLSYGMNKCFVFKSREKKGTGFALEFLRFLGAALLLQFVEIYGLLSLCCIWGAWDLVAHAVVTVIVVVLNYLLSKHFVFKEKKFLEASRQKEARRRKVCIGLGFAIPACCMLIGFALNGIAPFGTRATTIIDAVHQYLPFFTDFRSKLVNGESLMYSFGGGFGYNMWATIAYYLASPLNYLVALIPMKNVVDFMGYVTLLKIALSGAAFAWYLVGKGKNGKSGYLPVPFACMYALSSFMVGYYYNLMWLDSIMVVPFLMYGIEHIVDGKHGRLYGLALAYGLFCNYYIGYMLCLFSCLYFITLWISKKRATLKGFLKSSLKFGWFSLLSGGMAAVMLLPAFFNLQITESVDDSFPDKVKFFVHDLEQMTGHYLLVDPINIYDNQSGVNIYCGVIVLILVLLYLLDHERRIAERVSKGFLLFLMALSMNFNMLNYIWHGFHTQNGLPNRFAFLYIALLLSMGFTAIQDLHKQGNFRIAVAWALPIIFVAYTMATECGDRQWYVYIFTMLLLVWYGVLLLSYANSGSSRPFIRMVLTVAMTAEIAIMGCYEVAENHSVDKTSYVKDQSVYQTLIKRNPPGDEFVRTEIDSQRMRNENMYIGANGIVMFSSTMPAATVDLCKSIGMEARMNKTGYVGVTKLFNDVFGIRYLLSKRDSDTVYHMKKLDYEEPLFYYENEDALSLGFMVSKDLKQWDINQGEPMDVQRMFAVLATGEPFSYTLREEYSYSEGPVYIVRLHPGEQTYIQVKANAGSLTVKTPNGEKTYNDYTKSLFDLGTVTEEGEDSKANVSLTYKNGNTSPIQVQIYTCEDEEYQAVYDKLAANQMTEVKETGNQVTGNLKADQDGMLFLTVPYDEGWTVYVDGEERETYRVGEAFTGLDLEAGTHQITMEFTPVGFWQGTGLSALCIILYLISCLFEEQKKREKLSESGII